MMVRMFHEPIDPEEPAGDSGDGWIELQALLGKAEEPLRKIGLYVDHSHPVPNEAGAPAALIVCTLGDVAFGDRVQHPENYSVDAEFKKMTIDMGRDEWLDRRTQIQKNVAEGRSPLDNGTTEP